MCNYTLMDVQFLEGNDDFFLPMNLQSKYQTSYNLSSYGAWSSSLHVPDVGTDFSFSGNWFMIVKTNIDDENIGLFILWHVHVPPKQSVEIMSFCSPIYNLFDYLNIVKYKHRILLYTMFMNDYLYRKFNRKNLLYINGFPWTHGIITGFINSSRCSLFSTNCLFDEHFNN